MSYSFELRAPDKLGVKEMLSNKWDEIVEFQPEHQADRLAASAAARSALDLLPAEPGMDIVMSCHGSISRTPVAGGDHKLNHVNMSVTVGYINREARTA